MDIGRNDGKILSEICFLKEGRTQCRKQYMLQIRTETSGIVIALYLLHEVSLSLEELVVRQLLLGG